MAVARAHRNVSISLPTDLADQLDAWTEADRTSRSALVSDLIAQEKRRRLDLELEQAYREMTEDGFFDDFKFSLPAATAAVAEQDRLRQDAELELAYRDAVAEGFFDPAESEFYLPAAAEVILANPWDESEAR